MSVAFHRLKIGEVREETGQTKSLVFDVPTDLEETFRWLPGQHVTLRAEIGGEEVRRAYSIASSPLTGSPLRLAIKRVAEGVMSNHLNDTIAPGDELEVMAPRGSFYLKPEGKARRTHYFFAAGSGITPIFSMITSALLAEPNSAVNLLYGNRDNESIIFLDALERLQGRFGRIPGESRGLSVVHTLSLPSRWSAFDAWTGRIDEVAVARFLDRYPAEDTEAHYWICGPGGMNAMVRRVLTRHHDIPEEQVHLESFGAGGVDLDDSVEGVQSNLQVVINGDKQKVEVPKGKTLLEAMLDAGIDAPYSCQSGACSTCKAHLSSGNVHLRARLALDDSELEDGIIVTCQAVPTTKRVTVEFDS